MPPAVRRTTYPTNNLGKLGPNNSSMPGSGWTRIVSAAAYVSDVMSIVLKSHPESFVELANINPCRGGELKGPYGHMIQPELATPPTNKR